MAVTLRRLTYSSTEKELHFEQFIPVQASRLADACRGTFAWYIARSRRCRLGGICPAIPGASGNRSTAWSAPRRQPGGLFIAGAEGETSRRRDRYNWAAIE